MNETITTPDLQQSKWAEIFARWSKALKLAGQSKSEAHPSQAQIPLELLLLQDIVLGNEKVTLKLLYETLEQSQDSYNDLGDEDNIYPQSTHRVIYAEVLAVSPLPNQDGAGEVQRKLDEVDEINSQIIALREKGKVIAFDLSLLATFSERYQDGIQIEIGKKQVEA